MRFLQNIIGYGQTERHGPPPPVHLESFFAMPSTIFTLPKLACVNCSMGPTGYTCRDLTMLVSSCLPHRSCRQTQAICSLPMCFRCGHAMSEAVKNHHCADIREEVGTYEYCSNCYAGTLVALLVWMEVSQKMQSNRFKHTMTQQS